MQAGREVDIPVYDFVAHSRYEALVSRDAGPALPGLVVGAHTFPVLL